MHLVDYIVNEFVAFILLVLIVGAIIAPFSMIGDAVERRYGRATRRRIAWIIGGAIIFAMFAVPIGAVVWGHAIGRH